MTCQVPSGANVHRTRWAGSSKTFNNSGIELHKCLKFGTLVVLFDPLKVFQKNVLQFNYHHWKIFPYISYGEATKVHLLLRPFPKLVGSANCTSLFFTSLLQILIAWLDQIIFQKKSIVYSFSRFLGIQLNAYIYVTHWAKTRHFRTFLEFLFIASVFCIVSKEWTAKVLASCDAYIWSYSTRKFEQ